MTARVRDLEGKATVRFAAAAAFAAGLAASGAVADELFKWKDEKGRVHYSNVAPSEKQAERVGGDAEAPAAEAEAPPPVEAPGGGSAAADAGDDSAPAPSATPSAYSSLSDDAFSSRVSRERSRMRRDLRGAKTALDEIDGRIAELRRVQSQAIRTSLPDSVLPGQRPETAVTPQEAALLKEREEAAKRVEAIRKDYADLREEAVQRYGSQPPWWLPLE